MPGASIAIDDCYELWESGFVSIPYNFELRDLEPQLQRLLRGSADSQSGTANEHLSDSETYSEDGDWPAEGQDGMDPWHQSDGELYGAPNMEGSASADTSAALSATALAAVPPEDFISSSHSDHTSNRLGEWPARPAMSGRGVNSAALSKADRRLGRAYRKGMPLPMILGQRLACQRHCQQQHLPCCAWH